MTLELAFVIVRRRASPCEDEIRLFEHALRGKVIGCSICFGVPSAVRSSELEGGTNCLRRISLAASRLHKAVPEFNSTVIVGWAEEAESADG